MARTIAEVLAGAGFKGQGLQMGVAIAMAESGGDAKSKSPPNRDGTIDRGLMQVNSGAHPDVTDKCAYDADCNARAAFKISNGGTNWQPWSTYNNGDYRAFYTGDNRKYMVKNDTKGGGGSDPSSSDPGLGADLLGAAGDALSSLSPVSGIDDLAKLIANPSQGGALLINVTMWALRLSAKAAWRYVIAPPIHASQRAVAYYGEEMMAPRHYGAAGDDFAWVIPSTIAFWGLGGALLFGKADDTPNMLAPAHNTVLGKGLKKAFATGNRRKLHKPKDRSKHTPPKPTPSVSTAPIAQVRTMSASRRRAIAVTERGSKDGPTDKTESSKIPADKLKLRQQGIIESAERPE